MYVDFNFLRLILPGAIDKANKRADDLARKLEQSEAARKKAEQDAASIGDLRKRLHHVENALSEKMTQQIAREEAIIGRLESQNRRFVSKFPVLIF
jgi:dsDNA-specific endonuclease/ATPase MutS2